MDQKCDSTIPTSCSSRPILCFDADILGPWVVSALGFKYHPNRYSAVGELVDGVPRVGVLYESYTGTNVNCHIRGVGNWANRRVLAHIFDYPFNQLGCLRMTCFVRSDNEPSIKLMAKMGFELESALKQAIPDGDILIFRMFREDCKYLGVRYGRRIWQG